MGLRVWEAFFIHSVMRGAQRRRAGDREAVTEVRLFVVCVGFNSKGQVLPVGTKGIKRYLYWIRGGFGSLWIPRNEHQKIG